MTRSRDLDTEIFQTNSLIQSKHLFVLIIINHDKRTRNNECLLRLPNIKTEYARKSNLFLWEQKYTTCQLKYAKLRNEDFEILLEDYF